MISSDIVNSVYYLFDQGSDFFLLFLILLVVSIVISKNKAYIQNYVVLSLVGVFVVFNPILITFATKLLVPTRAVRIYWLFPITVVMAYTLTELSNISKEKKIRFVLVVVFSCVLMLQGDLILKKGTFRKSPNLYKVPNEVISICDAIEEDGNDGLLVSCMDYIEYYRQYDGNIKLLYPRELDENGTYHLYFGQETYDMDVIIAVMKQYGAKYLVLDKDHEKTKSVDSYNVKMLFESDFYVLYKLNE